MNNIFRKGLRFENYEASNQSPFDKLFEVFKELITHTSGDVDEALDWLAQLDKEYELTTPEYSLDDFIEDLKKKGYLKEEIDPQKGGGLAITAKTERAIRQKALDQIFGKLKRSRLGNHKGKTAGQGDEHTGEYRNYHYGDALERISMTESIKTHKLITE